jgi:hypothetical protein
MPTSEAARLAAVERHRPVIDAPQTYGPGPLSPAWRQPEAPPPPVNEWDAIARDLEAIRSGARAAIRSDEPGPPYFLTLEERACIEASVAALKLANRDILMHHDRVSDVEAWPTPVLPRGVLLGARDILGVLDTAITCARLVSNRAQWLSRAENAWARPRS